MDQKQSQSGFLNGLLLGLVIGAGLVLLLATKKGKRVLRMISEDGLDSVTSLEDLYEKLEKALQEDEKHEKVVASEKPEVIIPVHVSPPAPQAEVTPEPEVTPELSQASVITLPQTPIQTVAEEKREEVAEAVEEEMAEEVPADVASKPRIIAVDHETSVKLAEMQARLDREIHAVSEAIANNYVPYADDDIDEEEPVTKAVKATRRRFFRGTPSRRA